MSGKKRGRNNNNLINNNFINNNINNKIPTKKQAIENIETSKNLTIKTNIDDLPLLSYCNESQNSDVDTILDGIFTGFNEIFNMKKHFIYQTNPLMCFFELKYNITDECIILSIFKNKIE